MKFRLWLENSDAILKELENWTPDTIFHKVLPHFTTFIYDGNDDTLYCERVNRIHRYMLQDISNTKKIENFENLIFGRFGVITEDEQRAFNFYDLAYHKQYSLSNEPTVNLPNKGNSNEPTVSLSNAPTEKRESVGEINFPIGIISVWNIWRYSHTNNMLIVAKDELIKKLVEKLLHYTGNTGSAPHPINEDYILIKAHHEPIRVSTLLHGSKIENKPDFTFLLFNGSRYEKHRAFEVYNMMAMMHSDVVPNKEMERLYHLFQLPKNSKYARQFKEFIERYKSKYEKKMEPKSQQWVDKLHQAGLNPGKHSLHKFGLMGDSVLN